jgi:hypothetical protein
MSEPTTSQGSSHRGRSAAAIAFVVVGALLAGVAVPAIWVNRTVMDTEGWLRAVAPLASEPVVQDALADRVSTRLVDAIDIPRFVRERLPPVAQPFAGPIADAFENAVQTRTRKFTHSDAFPKVWIEMNRVGHTAADAAVTRREGGVISNQSGTVSLNTEPLVRRVQQRLVTEGFSVAEKIPTSRLETSVVLFSSPQLARAERLVDVLQAAGIWLPTIAIVCFAVALVIAPDRRKGLVWIGVGLVVAQVLFLAGFYLAKFPVMDAASSVSGSEPTIASIAYDVVLRDLFTAEWLVAALGLATWIGAALAGPAGWATYVRSGAKRAIGAVRGR